MEIRRVLRGEPAGFAPARPAGSARKETPAARPAADRVELSRQWVKQAEEQRAQAALASAGQQAEEDSGGILGYMETEEEKLDALSEQQKCMEIARRIMAGKKVPPQDERYLMEHDPEGYKLTMALRKPPKQDEKECESVLKDEKTGETAPAECSSGEEE